MPKFGGISSNLWNWWSFRSTGHFIKLLEYRAFAATEQMECPHGKESGL